MSNHYTFCYINLLDKQSFFVIIVLYCTVLHLFFLFRKFKNFFTLGHINLANPLFWERERYKKVLLLIQGLSGAMQVA